MPPPQSPMPTGQAALVAQLKRYFVTTRASKSNRRTLKQRPVWLDWWWRQLHSSTGRQHGRVVAERAFERIFSRWAFLGVVEGSRENFRCASLQSTGGVSSPHQFFHYILRRLLNLTGGTCHGW